MVGNITFLMIFTVFLSVAVNTIDKLQFLLLIKNKCNETPTQFVSVRHYATLRPLAVFQMKLLCVPRSGPVLVVAVADM